MSDATVSIAEMARGESGLPARMGRALRRFLRVRLAGWGLAVFVLVVILAIGADVIAPYDPLQLDYAAVLEAPSRSHLMGTDNLGRDVLSRVIHGSRISVQVGLVAVGLATLAGSILGLAAGYGSRMVDEVLMRITDALYSFPALILALAITAALGPSIVNAMIAIGIVYTPPFARLVRAQMLSVREWDFVSAATALGADPVRIMVRHIWPNITAPIIVQASLSVSLAIIVEASLSFLGVGVRPPAPSWGSSLYVGYQYLETAPWMSLCPGAAIFVTVLGLNLLGDGLREALDPRLRRRGE